MHWAPLRSALQRRAPPASHDEAPASILRLHPDPDPACHPIASVATTVTRNRCPLSLAQPQPRCPVTSAPLLARLPSSTVDILHHTQR